MKRTSLAAVSLLVMLLCLTPRDSMAQLNQPLHRDGWILAVAHAPGLQQSIWRTDLWVFVRTATTATVNLSFCESSQDNSGVQPFVVNVTGGKTVHYFEDVVEQFLHVGDDPWLGAIHYTSTADVQVWARVYSVSPDGTKSYGQLVEGIRTADLTPDDDPWDTSQWQWMVATKHTTDGRFRVNVGIVNPTSVATRVVANLYDQRDDATVPGVPSALATVPAYSLVQLTDPFAQANGGAWDNYRIRTHANEEGSGIFAYASVVDNATNDAYFVRGVKLRGQTDGTGLNCTAHNDGWILAAAHAPGLQGSIWRTDLWIARKAGAALDVNLTFARADLNNTGATVFTASFAEDQRVLYLEDVVDHYLDVGDGTWLGAIHYAAEDDIQVWARVYSISPDGTRSFGQLVEGVPDDDASPATNDEPDVNEYQWLFAGRHTADRRFRANLGIVNPSAVAGHYTVYMYTSEGTGVDEVIERDLPPRSMTQLGDPFSEVDGGEWAEKQIMVEVSGAGAKAFAYLSVIDNATNDAYFVRGIKRKPYPAP